MDTNWMKHYEQAQPFDEGEIFHSKEYGRVIQKEMELYRLLVATFGANVEPLLDAYTDALGDKSELECQHFFQQGFSAERNER